MQSILILVLVATAAAPISAATDAASSLTALLACQTTYINAVKLAPTNLVVRCNALLALSSCFSSASLVQRDVDRANSYLGSLQFKDRCTNYALPQLRPQLTSDGSSVTFRVDPDQEIRVSKSEVAESISIWQLNDRIGTLEQLAGSLCSPDTITLGVSAVEEDTTTAIAGLDTSAAQKISDLLAVVSSQVASTAKTFVTYGLSVQAAQLSTYMVLDGKVSQLGQIASSTAAQINIMSGEVNNNHTSSLSSMNAAWDLASASLMAKGLSTRNNLFAQTSTIQTTQLSVSTLASSMDATSTGSSSTISIALAALNPLYSVMSTTTYLNPQVPVYRWAVWSTYAQAFGNWYAGNTAGLFGGVAPSTWGDGNGVASQLSSSKEVLRGLFNKRGFAGWTASLHADEWYSYSSTNSRHFGALFRIRNTLSSNVAWSITWYYSMYGGWSEAASVTVNGADTWKDTSSGGCGFCTASLNLLIPANRVSTVIFIASSGAQSGTRTLYSAFYNDCLKLPTGLQYVDDMDTINGDWST